MTRDRSADGADVLLVEDEPGDVRLVEEAFRKSDRGTALHVVRDGVEATNFLFREGEYGDAPRPHLVLLDLNLPRKSGVEVLADIRADDSLRPLPVVVLTVSETVTDVQRTYERSANAYVPKPDDPDAFVETVEAIEAFWLSKAQLPDL